ncbi:PREDICTED: uncharacterized protein LOC104798801 isoform X2 [Tarenaya hassleriana]|uniref:uncharacterized protein LOC104798801 isoform X2 n=1 Tax=Tarenaya hassleriana TaxID=28532 RepID=UPI00053C5EF7|nr:PREDICTED: uncharacterized protein LOC104798801 isoform X2 [Tarenaya hassleriana]
MGSSGDQLSVHSLVETIRDILKKILKIEDVSERLSRLNDFVKDFQEEMKKIDGYKREVPLSMLLVKEAISYLKEEAKKCSAENARSVSGESMPLKKRRRKAEECTQETKEEEEEDGNTMKWLKSDKEMMKKNRVSPVQLRKQDDHTSNPSQRRIPDRKITNRVESKGDKEGSRLASLSKGCESVSVKKRTEGEEEISSSMRSSKEETGKRGIIPSDRKLKWNLRSVPQMPQQQQGRWSLGLHGVFVNVLDRLGGVQERDLLLVQWQLLSKSVSLWEWRT